MKLTILLGLLTFGWATYADTITLKNGRTIEGTYLGGDARRVRMTVGDSVQTFDTIDIITIRFGDIGSLGRDRGGSDSQSSSDRPTLRRSPRSAGDDQRSASNIDRDDRPTLRRSAGTSDNPPPDNSGQDERPIMRRTQRPPDGDTPEPRILKPDVALIPQTPIAVEVPPDTPFVIRMIDSVDSEHDTVGNTFRASMDQPITINGKTVIPRGADVVVKLVEDKQSGKLTGKTELRLDLSSVTVNGRNIDILTQTITKESGSRGASTAKKAGGGAALGAIIGGIAGGGAGAAIGAAAGAGAGTAAQVMTKGQRVKIPSETRLTFKLEQAITI